MLEREELKEMGVFWKRYREKAGLTQEQLSKSLGYQTSQFVSKIERGDAFVPPSKIFVLSKLLGVGPRKVEIFYNKIYGKAVNRLRRQFSSEANEFPSS